jgi:hypothetical protein
LIQVKVTASRLPGLRLSPYIELLREAETDMANDEVPVGGFCTGTLLMTLRGEVPVETVRAGEKALTLSGVDAPLKPVTWVRHRRIDLGRHPRPGLAAPVRVREGAVDDGVPIRDLRVSPDVALSVEDGDGTRVLVPVLLLANGATILREPAAGTVTYVTVSLERHDILMGDGMAAESGPGRGKDAVAPPARPPGSAPPADFSPRPREGLCAPLVLNPAALAIHARLLARAKELGYAETDAPEISVSVSDAALEPLGVSEGTYRWRLPPGTERVLVASRSYVPVEANPATGDARRLGVALARLRLGGEELALNDETCVAGFHPLEGDGGSAWRWTRGDATLALPPRATESELEMTIHQGWGRYWTPPPDPPPSEEEAPPP